MGFRKKRNYLPARGLSCKIKRHFMKKSGFTLIELLVVIVIVGVIAGFLLPTMSGVRSSARRLQCMNNMRQVGVAFYMYLDDNNEQFPIMLPPCWQVSINKYIDDQKVWGCPGQPGVGYGEVTSPFPFAYNYRLGNPAVTVTLQQVKNKAFTVLLGDSTVYFPMGSNSHYYLFGPMTDFRKTHSGGDNYIFVDGHSQWYSYDEMSAHDWNKPAPDSWFDLD